MKYQLVLWATTFVLRSCWGYPQLCLKKRLTFSNTVFQFAIRHIAASRVISRSNCCLVSVFLNVISRLKRTSKSNHCSHGSPADLVSAYQRDNVINDDDEDQTVVTRRQATALFTCKREIKALCEIQGENYRMWYCFTSLDLTLRLDEQKCSLVETMRQNSKNVPEASKMKLRKTDVFRCDGQTPNMLTSCQHK